MRQTSHSHFSLGGTEACHVMGPQAQPAYNFARPLSPLEPVPLKLLKRAGPESLSHWAQYIEMKARVKWLEHATGEWQRDKRTDAYNLTPSTVLFPLNYVAHY